MKIGPLLKQQDWQDYKFKPFRKVILEAEEEILPGSACPLEGSTEETKVTVTVYTYLQAVRV